MTFRSNGRHFVPPRQLAIGSDYIKSLEPTLSKTYNVTIIPMFLTDCDKSHLFFRHGELQIPGAENYHSTGDRSRSFGPGDVQAEALANRHPNLSSPPPRLLAGLRHSLLAPSRLHQHKVGGTSLGFFLQSRV